MFYPTLLVTTVTLRNSSREQRQSNLYRSESNWFASKEFLQTILTEIYGNIWLHRLPKVLREEQADAII